MHSLQIQQNNALFLIFISKEKKKKEKKKKRERERETDLTLVTAVTQLQNSGTIPCLQAGFVLIYNGLLKIKYLPLTLGAD